MRVILVMLCALLAAACASGANPRPDQSTDKRAERMLNDRQAEQEAYCRRVGTARRDPECPAAPSGRGASALPQRLPVNVPSDVPELPSP